MLPVLSGAEMRECDRLTIEEGGLPGAVLMENAGAAVAAALRERFPAARRIALLCGPGNNGGDGFVAARRLPDLEAEIYLLGSHKDVRGDARQHLAAYGASGGRLNEVPSEGAWAAHRERAFSADVIVDALLGTGLNRAPDGLIGHVIAQLESGAGLPPVLSVDLPSGVSSDSGVLPGAAVRATLTVALGAPKHGHVLPPACDRVGELRVAGIGIPAAVIDKAGSRLGLLVPTDAARAFPPRAPGAHKGDFGHVLVIAGSLGKSGAAILSALGALRAGVGLVTVATPAPALPLVAAGRPELMTEPLPIDDAGGLDREAVRRAMTLARERDAVVLGPGLGQEPGTREFVRQFLPQCPVPLVVDADGLNALAGGPRSAAEFLRGLPAVVTPHPGEMARISGIAAADVQRGRLEAARAFANRSGAVVVLKGQRTLVADASGRTAVNPTGNPGMASGGTGDVLAGIVGALLARRCPAWLAATAAVFVHGSAGDRALARLGTSSLLAGDLIDSLPEALRALAGARA
jgi:NAD(P)H-hydrate epimerase